MKAGIISANCQKVTRKDKRLTVKQMFWLAIELKKVMEADTSNTE